MFKKLINCAKLMRMHKPIGFFLLLWPTLIALWVASQGNPDPLLVCLFILGTFMMRSAGCIINDIFDLPFDGQVSRCQNRPLVQGLLKQQEAWILFAILILFSFILVCHLNVKTRWLSVVAILLVMIYPWMKRVTHLPQAFLGFTFAWSIPMSFMAVQNHLAIETWILYGATLFWVMAYDTAYAMADREDDLKISVKSMAILFADYDKAMILLFQGISLGLFVLLGYYLTLGTWFFMGVLAAVCCCLYQQYLMKDRHPNKCLEAFLNNHYVGAFLFVGCFLAYYF